MIRGSAPSNKANDPCLKNARFFTNMRTNKLSPDLAEPVCLR